MSEDKGLEKEKEPEAGEILKQNQETPEEKAAREKEAKKAGERSTQIVFIVAVVAVIVIIAGIFALKYLGSEPEYETVTYNHFTFTKIVGMWHTQWQYENEIYTIPLRFNPYEAESVRVSGSLNDSWFNTQNKTYITFDPTVSELNYTALATAELSINLAQVIGISLEAACTENETEFCRNVTTAVCGDEDKAVIYFKQSEEAAVLFDNKCITVQGKGFDLVKAVDRLLYKWYGIMP